MNNKKKLALYGGTPIRKTPFPERFAYDQKEKKIVNQIFNSAIRTGKPIRYSEKYEKIYLKKFSTFMNGGYCDLVNSGTNAFLCSLAALEIKPGSEIIIPVVNDPGGVMPVFFLGLIPVPVDISKSSYNTSVDEIKKKISKKTKAVLVCHIGGEPADIVPIKKFLNLKKIKLIEDCSQSHGAKINNKRVGTFGDISFFSTMSSKLHSTGGQGGIIYSKSKQLINKAKMFADRGKKFNNGNFTGKYSTLGLNCNIDEISAAIGCVQLDKLPRIIKQTNKIGNYISKKLNEIKSPSSIEINKNYFNVFWFLRLKLDLNKINVSKKIYCKALKSEGLNVDEKYIYNPFFHEWYLNKIYQNFFKKTLLENKIHEKNYSNYNYVHSTNYNIYIRENYSNKDINDIVNAISKIDSIFKI